MISFDAKAIISEKIVNTYVLFMFKTFFLRSYLPVYSHDLNFYFFSLDLLHILT